MEEKPLIDPVLDRELDEWIAALRHAKTVGEIIYAIGMIESILNRMVFLGDEG